MQNLPSLSESFERVGWVVTRRTMADAFPEGLEFRFFLKNDEWVVMKLNRFQILFLLMESKTIYDRIDRHFRTILDVGHVTIWIPRYVEMSAIQLMTFMDKFRDGAVKFSLDTSVRSVVMLSSFLFTKYPVLEYIKGISHIELAQLLQIVLNERLNFRYKPILKAICKIIYVPFNRFRKLYFTLDTHSEKEFLAGRRSNTYFTCITNCHILTTFTTDGTEAITMNVLNM